MTTVIIKQIDIGLERYYLQNGVKDYKNKDGVGRFIVWCQENGFDSSTREEVTDELQSGPEDCFFVEFDENFPLKNAKNLSDEQKKKAIYDVLVECFNDPDAYRVYDDEQKGIAFRDVTKEIWDVSEKEIKEYAKQQQYIKAIRHLESDEDFAKMLVITQKLGYPWIQFLIDMYSAKRAENFMKGEETWDLDRFIKRTPYFQALEKRLGLGTFKARDTFKAGLYSFAHRVAPQLLILKQRAIYDSLREISKIIADNATFVGNLIKNGQTCPFQYDCSIAYRYTSFALHHPELHVDSDDDDDDEPQVSPTEWYDCWGDIPTRLNCENEKHKKLPYTEEKAQRPYTKLSRTLGDKFKELQTKIQSKEQVDDYPRRRRFCVVIDRRNKKKPLDIDEELAKAGKPPQPGKKKKKKNAAKDSKDKPDVDEKKEEKKDDEEEAIEDPIYMYEPPADCNKFPEKGPYEQILYWDQTRKCILPGINYKIRGKDTQEFKLNAVESTITGKTALRGGIMIFSFHVEAADEVRLYMWFATQVTRFEPNYITDLMPLFFAETPENKAFVKSAEAAEIRTQIAEVVKDRKYRAFKKFFNSHDNK